MEEKYNPVTANSEHFVAEVRTGKAQTLKSMITGGIAGLLLEGLAYYLGLSHLQNFITILSGTMGAKGGSGDSESSLCFLSNCVSVSVDGWASHVFSLFQFSSASIVAISRGREEGGDMQWRRMLS